jgi:hypothetical protein
VIEHLGIFERHLGRLFLPVPCPLYLPTHQFSIPQHLSLSRCTRTHHASQTFSCFFVPSSSPFPSHTHPDLLISPRMAVATSDATKEVTRSMRSMKEGAEKLSHVPAKRRASQKNGAGLIPPATSKVVRFFCRQQEGRPIKGGRLRKGDGRSTCRQPRRRERKSIQ